MVKDWTDADMEVFLEGLADVLVETIGDAIRPLQERLDALERGQVVSHGDAGLLLEQVKSRLVAELGRVP